MEEPLAIQALRVLSVAISSSGRDESDLIACMNALESVPGSTVAQKLKKIKSNYGKNVSRMKAPAQLKSLVSSACTLYGLTGPKSVAKDLLAIFAAVGEAKDGSAEEFIHQLSSSITKPAKKVKTRNLTSLDAKKFSDDLTRAIEDRDEFERMVVLLTGPRAHSMERINEVAQYFLGYSTSFRTKKQAAEAFKQRQADTVIGGGQIKHIQELPI